MLTKPLPPPFAHKRDRVSCDHGARDPEQRDRLLRAKLVVHRVEEVCQVGGDEEEVEGSLEGHLVGLVNGRETHAAELQVAAARYLQATRSFKS